MEGEGERGGGRCWGKTPYKRRECVNAFDASRKCPRPSQPVHPIHLCVRRSVHASVGPSVRPCVRLSRPSVNPYIHRVARPPSLSSFPLLADPHTWSTDVSFLGKQEEGRADPVRHTRGETYTEKKRGGKEKNKYEEEKEEKESVYMYNKPLSSCLSPG